ncbi:hypothetical protein E0Z10_g3397 [Xylaria hypoxylon]|uniref:HPt domain-containing protein n=1 Tax=Xylaria hypoxylon TaxID=37992 RepID=A0A4Z0YNS6_9PEZI|nr:hypothetical protein E0Z10_g3397 [Xylaria hypoxylon]
MAGHDKNDDGFDGNMPDLGDAIDLLTFSQILDMDDSEEDREFSRSIVYGFFEQAEETFEKMDEALKARDLEELYRLGHYLKGSSATVGLTKVKDSCEKIQRYGKKENVDGTPEPDVELCLSRIKSTLITVKSEYIEAEKTLKKFFDSA